MSSSTHRRINGLSSDDLKNGNPGSAFTIVDQMSNSYRLNGDLNANYRNDSALRLSKSISTPDQRTSDQSNTWEDNGNKGI